MLKTAGFGMARRVKSLVEAKPKITKLYDSFIESESDKKAADSFESEFLAKPASASRKDQLVPVEEELDPATQHFVATQLLDEPFKHATKTHTHRVLKKLDKDTRWGLAGELVKLKSKGFDHSRLPDTEEVKEFLMQEMFKDIEVFDLVELNKNQLADIGILATGYSNRHVYKAAKTLSKEMEKLDEGILKNEARVHGRKDDEWVMICIGTKFVIHLMTENAREDAAIGDKWMDQVYCQSGALDVEGIKKKFKEYENPFKFRNVNK